MNTESSGQFFRGLVAQPKCAGCPLEGSKKVPPEGNPHAMIAIVGEGPGYLEEIEGRPFTGPSGQFLNTLLVRAGIDRSTLWITNTTLCKPKTVIIDGKPQNQDVVVRLAAKYCKSRLDEELFKIRPKVIVGLGSQSVKSLYSSSASLKGRRGAIHALDLLNNSETSGEE